MEEEIIEKKESRKHEYHRSYGPWKPGRILDNGKGMKKRGMKKGTVLLKETEVSIELERIVNYLTFGKSKIENEENKKEKLIPNTPMNVPQACRELGITAQTFYIHLNKFPGLQKKYQELRENRREYLKESAEINVQSALTGKSKSLSEKDVLDASFKFLERTDKAYNPKIEIESKSVSINLNKTSEDLYNDLAQILGLKKD